MSVAFNMLVFRNEYVALLEGSKMTLPKFNIRARLL